MMSKHNTIILIFKDQDAHYGQNESFQKLNHNNLIKQGYSRIYDLVWETYTDKPSKWTYYDLNGFESDPFRGLDHCCGVMVILDPNFICLNLKSLWTQFNPSCPHPKLALRLKDGSSNYPYFDSMSHKVEFSFFTDDWVDAYENTGTVIVNDDQYRQWIQVNTESLDLKTLDRLFEDKMIGTPVSGWYIDPLHHHFDFEKISQKVDHYFKKELKPCLFLDRDGIVNIDTHYPHIPELLEPIPDIIDIMKWARGQGWFIIILTNQSGIARGIFQENDFNKCSNYLDEWFETFGQFVDHWFYCPYHIDGKDPMFSFHSLKRKPLPGMILQAMEKFPIDLEKSIMIGDNLSDCIKISGLRTFLINKNLVDKNIEGAQIFQSHKELFKFLKE